MTARGGTFAFCVLLSFPMAGFQTDGITDQALYTVTIETADDTEKFRRCVRADGARCGAGDRAAGICRIKSGAAGEFVPVDVHGIVQAEAGAAIVLVDGVRPVKAGADGRLVPVGALDPDPVVGLAVSAAAAAGKFFSLLLLDAEPSRTMMLEHGDANEVHQRFVAADGNRCAANQQMIGVSLTESATLGEQLRVQTDGIVRVVAGAAIALANGSKKVKSDAQGRAITHTANTPSGGLALDAANAAGEVVRVAQLARG